MAKTEAKQQPGRKRKYPEGSAEYRFRVPPDVQEALQAFIERQKVRPDNGQVILAALTKFLIDDGCLKDGHD